MTKDKPTLTMVFNSVEERQEWLNDMANEDQSIANEMSNIVNHSVKNIVVKIEKNTQSDNRQMSLPFEENGTNS